VLQRFRSVRIPLEKKSFGWECSRSCNACCISSSDLKDLHPIASLSGPKTWKSLGARSGEYGGCGRHSKDSLGLLQQLNGQYGTELCHVEAKHLYSDVHVVWAWLQDTGDSLDLHTLYWSQGSPWACSAPKLPLVYPKTVSITFPAIGCVRNFFGFGEGVWRHSSLVFSGFPAGGSGPKFHLPNNSS